MATANPTTVAELIWWGFCALLATGFADIIRRLWRIEKKQDDFKDNCPKCKEEIMSKMVDKDYMTHKWEPGRKEIWDALNRHSHDSATGKVIRG